MTEEATRTALQIALQAAIRDRDRATATISFLTEKLGMAESGAIVLGPGEIESDAEGARDVGPIQVTEGEFYGMSQPKAAAIYLERAGRSRPQPTREILAALKRGGVEFGGKDPATTFYTILTRNSIFHNLGKGTWGLSAWYGSAVTKARKTNASASSTADTPDDDRSDPSADADEEPMNESE